MNKTTYIEKLKKYEEAVNVLGKLDHEKLEVILINVTEIVSNFNLAIDREDNPFKLTEVENRQVKTILKSIWSIADEKGIRVTKPEPDLYC